MNNQNAIAHQDYEPLGANHTVEFAPGESQKVISIPLLNLPSSRLSTHSKYATGINAEKETEIDDDNDDEDSMSDEDIAGPKFKVIIEKAEPAGVKVSKKNACIIEIINHELEIKKDEEHTQLLNYFVGQKKPTWGAQFIQAIMLSPKVDEDNLIVE